MKKTFCLAILSAFLCAHGYASGEKKKPVAAKKKEEPTYNTADVAPSAETARRHYEAGRVFYEKSLYEDALREFKVAQAQHPIPMLEYDIGRCLDRLERYPEALEHYKTYLLTDPPDAAQVYRDIVRIERTMDAMKRIQPPQAPSKSPAPVTPVAPKPVQPIVAAPPAPAKPPSGFQLVWQKYKLPIVIGAAGLAVAVMGAGLEGSAYGDYGDLKDRRLTCPSCDLSSEISTFEVKRDLGVACLAIGSAAALTAGTLALIKAYGKPATERPHVLLLPTVGGAVLNLTF
ncbi:MAG TPA: tetratricopeptide repeat protein [Patescibacteria group bacterium]|nr:tetratricopeptide repeat protein [Patescibacteria group bacterium]